MIAITAVLMATCHINTETVATVHTSTEPPYLAEVRRMPGNTISELGSLHFQLDELDRCNAAGTEADSLLDIS